MLFERIDRPYGIENSNPPANQSPLSVIHSQNVTEDAQMDAASPVFGGKHSGKNNQSDRPFFERNVSIQGLMRPTNGSSRDQIGFGIDSRQLENSFGENGPKDNQNEPGNKQNIGQKSTMSFRVSSSLGPNLNSSLTSSIVVPEGTSEWVYQTPK